MAAEGVPDLVLLEWAGPELMKVGQVSEGSETVSEGPTVGTMQEPVPVMVDDWQVTAPIRSATATKLQVYFMMALQALQQPPL